MPIDILERAATRLEKTSGPPSRRVMITEAFHFSPSNSEGTPSDHSLSNAPIHGVTHGGNHGVRKTLNKVAEDPSPSFEAIYVSPGLGNFCVSIVAQKVTNEGNMSLGAVKSPLPHSNYFDRLKHRLRSLQSSGARSSVKQLHINDSPPKAVTRTSLDTKVQNLPKKRTLSRKQKRAFQRFISGIKRARYFGKRVRFFTLTTAESAKWGYWSLTKHFQVLRKRIDRHWGRIEYCRVTTNEAFGVIHVVYAGGFIPQQWLSRNWEEIHESPIVDVRAIKGSNKRLAGYLASQYCSEQKASYTRMSWSWKWVFKGFVSVWYAIRKQYGLARGIREWNKVLMFRAETCSQQSILKVNPIVKST